MLQPVGPLSPQVYWRRRLAVLGGLAAVVLVGLAMCSGGNPGPAGPRGSAALTGTATPTAPAGTSTGGSSAPATLTPSPGSAGGPAPGSPTSSGAASPTGTTPGGGTDPGTGTGSGGGGSSAAGSTSPEPCPDAALTVQASTAKPTYQVGETPVLKLTVRNTGEVACVRDVGPRQQEMLLYAGTTRIWSSNDCYPDGGTDIRTLSPSEAVSSSVVWSGLSSQPGCAGTRTRVRAGTYQLVARVGSATGKPAKLVLQ